MNAEHEANSIFLKSRCYQKLLKFEIMANFVVDSVAGGVYLTDSEGEFSGFSSDDDLGIAVDVNSEIDDISGDSDSEQGQEENGAPRGNRDERWTKDDRTHIEKRLFTGPAPGPTSDLDPDSTSFNFFELFFPAFLLELMVVQTNLYCRQKQATKPDQNWRDVTVREMKAWLGIRIVMSIMPLPRTSLYWSNDELVGNQSPKRIMTRDRFSKICQYFHLNDNSHHIPRNQPGHDKLYHVRPIYDAVQECCLGNYNPNQNVSVDEAMIKFRGRLSFRQYLPAKPTKYGIKVWMRADPTNGYTNEFQVYTGKDAGTREVGLASRVVRDLTRRIWGKNHIVNVDNYFTSPALFEDLLQQDTYARGTVRSNRKGFPLQHLHKKDVRVQGDFKTAQRAEMTACLWMDKKPIYTLSTAEDPATIESIVQRKARNGEVKEVRAPSIIPEYNKNMNGVDVADQLRTQHSTYRPARKWWLYVFWFLFDVAVTNGFILMRESKHHVKRSKNQRIIPLNMVDFRLNLAKILIGDFQENERAALTTFTGGHYPKRGEKKGRCRQCSKDKRRREIVNMCCQCNVHLCIDCFQPYHADLLKNR